MRLNEIDWNWNEVYWGVLLLAPAMALCRGGMACRPAAWSEGGRVILLLFFSETQGWKAQIQCKFNWNSMISMRFPFISFRFWLKDFSLEAHRPCCSGTSPCFPGASQAGWHGAAAAAWRSSARRQTSFEDFLDNSIHSIKFTQRSLII